MVKKSMEGESLPLGWLKVYQQQGQVEGKGRVTTIIEICLNSWGRQTRVGLIQQATLPLLTDKVLMSLMQYPYHRIKFSTSFIKSIIMEIRIHILVKKLTIKAHNMRMRRTLMTQVLKLISIWRLSVQTIEKRGGARKILGSTLPSTLPLISS